MKKLLAVGASVFAIVGIVSVGTLNTYAMNGQGAENKDQAGMRQGNGHQSSLESRAKVLGMTADELKVALETKTMSQIAVDKGMNEETFRAKMAQAAMERWQLRGLSRDKIAKRVADREARHATNSADHEFGSGNGDRQGGYRANR